MKNLFTLLLALVATTAFSQTVKVGYDQKLAESLGADDYGMKNYVLVLLKTGPNKIEDQKKLDEVFKGHMENIEKMVAQKKLVVGGPFKKNTQDYRGLYIFDVASREEAQLLLANDPLITSSLAVAEVYDWYGSAALPGYLPLHAKIEKKKH